MGALGFLPPSATARQTAVDLDDAWDTAVLAGRAVNSTDLTRVTGDVVVSPGFIVTGFPPGVVEEGQIHRNDAAAQAAKADAVAAYNDAAGRTPTSTPPAQLGGRTLGPGVYKSRDNDTFLINGTLTLNAGGDPDAIFIFQSDTLQTARVSNIDLMNGAQENNIVWQVGNTATLGAYSTFRGNVLALNAVTVSEGAAVYGRVMGLNTTVVLDGTSTLPATRVTIPGMPSATAARRAARSGTARAPDQPPYRPPTSTSVSSSPNPSRLHEPVTFIAVVSGDYDGQRPTGPVLFKDGSTIMGSALADDEGFARFTTSELTRGVHEITAVYVDDGTGAYEAWVYFAPSESPVLQHQVLSRR
ncbi:ice-binding family protein [Nonomuraea sp. B19D2]|uniref:ice-binding family protein n=1 Tax=Nonomuraea sp. B19D2 TaxID=3159561 RepID=UPI0032D9DFA3